MDESEAETNLKCPYCRFDCVHIQAVEVKRGGEITCIDRQGTKVQAGEPSGRGARVEITFWCESGHKWTRSFQFHKGNLFVEDLLLENGCPNCMQGQDLWRD